MATMTEAQRERVVYAWSNAVAKLAAAADDFSQAINRGRLADSEFMRLYGVIVECGGDLDHVSAGGVGIDGLREILTGG